jgi:hypothetical protein
MTYIIEPIAQLRMEIQPGGPCEFVCPGVACDIVCPLHCYQYSPYCSGIVT